MVFVFTHLSVENIEKVKIIVLYLGAMTILLRKSIMAYWRKFRSCNIREKKIKVHLLKCDWFDVQNKESGYKIDNYSIMSINANRHLKMNEPFILAC